VKLLSNNSLKSQYKQNNVLQNYNSLLQYFIGYAQIICQLKTSFIKLLILEQNSYLKSL
jgi:hypothetical protein